MSKQPKPTPARKPGKRATDRKSGRPRKAANPARDDAPLDRVVEPAAASPAPESIRDPAPIAATKAASAVRGPALPTLFMEMAKENLDFAARLASARSPVEIFGVAAEFAGRRIGMYGALSRACAELAVRGPAPFLPFPAAR